MKINLQSNGFSKHSELFSRTVAERISVDFCDDGMTIELKVDKTISAAESFLICCDNNSWSIIGSDELGLYFGIGKFLHTAKWGEKDFVPKATNGVHPL